MKTKIFLFAILLLELAAMPVLSAQAFSLVPCGQTADNPCKLIDLITLLVRLINFLLAGAGIVAVYYVMMSGWEMVSSLGNPEKITRGKEGLSHALVGFGLILISFAVINMLLQGIFGLTGCNWWNNPTTLWSNSSCFFN